MAGQDSDPESIGASLAGANAHRSLVYGKLSSDVALELDIGPHSPKWLQRVRKLAADVENPKVTHPTKRAKTRKRACTELLDDEERDGLHDEHHDRQDEDDGGGSEQ
ncbi:hypothetical protein C8F01DRAFT_1091586 [Mycena amicta]|nr:hypothetical protein C8F01DRAFT_1091586 [Mycena amicta]